MASYIESTYVDGNRLAGWSVPLKSRVESDTLRHPNVTKLVDKGLLAPDVFEGSGTVVLGEGEEVDVVAGEPINVRLLVPGRGEAVMGTPLRSVTRGNPMDYKEV